MNQFIPVIVKVPPPEKRAYNPPPLPVVLHVSNDISFNLISELVNISTNKPPPYWLSHSINYKFDNNPYPPFLTYKYIAPPLSEAEHDVNVVFNAEEVPEMNTPEVIVLELLIIA